MNGEFKKRGLPMINLNRYPETGVAKKLLYKVYAFMAAALITTAVVAYYVAHHTTLMYKLLSNSWLLFGIFILQLLLVVALSAAILRISFPVAITGLIVYSILTGITFSTLFYMYTMQSLYTVFFVTSGMFACMALYGYFTHSDLSQVGKYSIMALCGLIIGFVINFFLKNGTFDYILTLAGVVIFTLLTAYDMQKIKQMSNYLDGQGETENKIAVLGALTLYLDFINLFLMLLRLMGRRKE